MATTLKSTLLDFLASYASQHGYQIVEQACREYLRNGRKAGVVPTKRKTFSTAGRRSLTLKLWKRQKGICARVRHPVAFEEATIDHFEPVRNGGAENPRNYRMVCREHNSAKGDNTPLEESRKTGATIYEMMPKGNE